MKNKFYIKFLAFIFSLAPTIAFAQLSGTRGFFENALSLVKTVLIPLVFALAVLFFFFGVARYIWSEGDKKEDGRKIMLWGIIALFVMASVWGLVAFLQTSLFGSGSVQNNMRIPTIGNPPGLGNI